MEKQHLFRKLEKRQLPPKIEFFSAQFYLPLISGARLRAIRADDGRWRKETNSLTIHFTHDRSAIESNRFA